MAISDNGGEAPVVVLEDVVLQSGDVWDSLSTTSFADCRAAAEAVTGRELALTGPPALCVSDGSVTLRRAMLGWNDATAGGIGAVLIGGDTRFDTVHVIGWSSVPAVILAVKDNAKKPLLQLTASTLEANADGAVVVRGGDLDVDTGTEFRGNQRAAGGADIDQSGGNVSIADSSFFAIDYGATTGPPIGGSITVRGAGKLAIVGSEFVSYRAVSGGTLDVRNAEWLTVDSVSFQGFVGGVGGGGAIYLENTPAAAIVASAFSDGTAASQGGAIKVVGGDLYVGASTFTDVGLGGGTTVTGGAIFGTSGATITLEDVDVVATTQSSRQAAYGGAVAGDGITLSIVGGSIRACRRCTGARSTRSTRPCRCSAPR